MRRTSRSARWSPVALAALVALALGGCDWPQTGGGVARTGFAPFETAINTQTVSGLRLRWSQPLPVSLPASSSVSSPVVAGGRVFVDAVGPTGFMSNTPITSAFDADRGDALWNNANAGFLATAQTPAVSGDALVTSRAGIQLEVHDVASGAVRWTASGSFFGPPTPADGHVFVPTYDGELRSYDLASGGVAWSTPAPFSMTPPTVANGLVLVAASDQRMLAYDEQTGAYRWTATIPNGGGEPAVTDGIGLSTGYGGIGAYDATSGSRWWWHNRVSLMSTPSTAYGLVYAVQNNAGENTRLYAFDVGTGATRWSAPIHAFTNSQPAIAGGVVFVGSGDGNLYGFDAHTGAQLWSVPTGAPIDTSPAIANGEIFVTTRAGYLDAFSLPPAAARLSVSPSFPAEFASTFVGDASDGQTFTVTNPGGVTSPTVTASFSGDGQSEFVRTADACTSHTLPAGGSCTVTVVFAPTRAGTSNANLDLSFPDGRQASVALTGSASAGPGVKITPQNTASAYGYVGADNPTTFTVTGLAFGGSGPLSVTLDRSPATAPFSIASDGCTGVSLAHGATCAIVVNFSPTTVQRVSVVVHVEYATAVLTEEGKSALAVDPFSFGNVTVGGHAQRTVTVRNQLSTPIGPLTTSLIAGQGGPVTVVSDGCQHATLAGHDSSAVVVDFAPVTVGDWAGWLDIDQAPDVGVSAFFQGAGV